MRWISRKEDARSTDVHFFSTQFFSKLTEGGPEAVSSWTAKKNINIFKKKFIFIPVNDRMHWSLCIVVNAGKIEHALDYYEDLEQGGREDSPYRDKDAPFMLFLDSLKAHRKASVRNHVIKWLNSEAERLNTFKQRDPFKKRYKRYMMPILDPQVPYQDNSWDCGVFVCQYAYKTLLLRNNQFTFEDLEEKLQAAITNTPEFEFCMEDIKLLRTEMKLLVDNLSKLYREIKSKERENRKAEKLKVKVLTEGKQKPSGGVVTTDVTVPTEVNEKVQSEPEYEEQIATTAEEGTDNDTLHENEFTGVMPVIADDQETEGDTLAKDQDQIEKLIQDNIVTDDIVDEHDEQERNSKSQMAEIDTTAGALPAMEEENLRSKDRTVLIGDQHSKEPILNKEETQKDFENWMKEDEKLPEYKYSENDEKVIEKDNRDDEESETQSKVFLDQAVKVEEDQGLTKSNSATKIRPIKIEPVLDCGG